LFVRRVASVVVVVGLVCGLAACGSSSKTGDAGGATTTAPAGKARPHVTIEAKDFSFTMPDTIPSGWVDVTLHNSGAEGHQIAFAKLNSMTFDQFKTATGATNVKALGDTVFVGGPNNAEPGGSVTATVHLEPGEYGVACFIPAKDGKAHAAHGMVAKVTVAQTAASVETEPTADAGTIRLSEFTFLPSTSFTGKGVVKVENVGTQLHEVILDRINEGKTLDDVKAWFLAGAAGKDPGPPPFTAAGGVVGLGSHQSMYQTLALTPGHYAMLCFFPDPTKGDVPHALEGMVKEITIS
jgi:uncharacterized cupredoxin-like copper-binding protein